MTDLNTIASNMLHAARNNESAEIGGGMFGPAELREAAKALREYAAGAATIRTGWDQAVGRYVEVYQGGQSWKRVWEEVKYTKATKAAITRYGYATCIDAFRSHDRDGEGTGFIGVFLGLTPRQVDAAINAGREIEKMESTRTH